MKKFFSEKNKNWSTKDIVLNTIIIAINFVLIFFMFLGALALNEKSGGSGYTVMEFLTSKGYNVTNFLILLLLIILLFVFFFAFEETDYAKESANTEMLFAIIEVSIIASFCFGRYVNIYLRPLAFAGILTLFLTDSRTAMFINVIFNLVMTLFDSFSGAFSEINSLIYYLLMGMASGTIAIYVLNAVYSRFKLVVYSFLSSIPEVLCIVIPFIWFAQTETNIWGTIAYALFSGPISVAIFLIISPFFEVIFKKVSIFKFAELSDHKAKLMKHLAKEAPGTFNHSIIIANIAEACATAIGEDSLLARTCAYYHDIGKLRRPEFFKENQMEGVNPHDDLTPELSATIIKSHAIDGYKLAIKNHLPQEIADVCREHHGTMPILYFYDKAKKFTDGEIDITEFCYQGPKPQTKISAIIMLADCCEAASRTVKDRSRESVANVVKKMINDRVKLGQLEECEITLKELHILENAITNTLTGIYHKRIEYPKVKIENLESDLEKAQD